VLPNASSACIYSQIVSQLNDNGIPIITSRPDSMSHRGGVETASYRFNEH